MATGSSSGKGAAVLSQNQAGPSSSEGGRPVTAPLGAVVTDAVRRWYLEASKEAAKGDVKQQALVGHMLMEGYGCQADPSTGKEWIDKARRRGYKMSGVYCEL